MARRLRRRLHLELVAWGLVVVDEDALHLGLRLRASRPRLGVDGRSPHLRVALRRLVAPRIRVALRLLVDGRAAPLASTWCVRYSATIDASAAVALRDASCSPFARVADTFSASLRRRRPSIEVAWHRQHAPEPFCS